MSRKRVRRARITKGEKLIYTGGLLSLILILVMQVFCGACIGELNVNVEKIKYDISVQEKKNESLEMKVNELTAFDKVKDVVKDMGLAYNNDNIVVVRK